MGEHVGHRGPGRAAQRPAPVRGDPVGPARTRRRTRHALHPGGGGPPGARHPAGAGAAPRRSRRGVRGAHGPRPARSGLDGDDGRPPGLHRAGAGEPAGRAGHRGRAGRRRRGAGAVDPRTRSGGQYDHAGRRRRPGQGPVPGAQHRPGGGARLGAPPVRRVGRRRRAPRRHRPRRRPSGRRLPVHPVGPDPGQGPVPHAGHVGAPRRRARRPHDPGGLPRRGAHAPAAGHGGGGGIDAAGHRARRGRPLLRLPGRRRPRVRPRRPVGADPLRPRRRPGAPGDRRRQRRCGRRRPGVAAGLGRRGDHLQRVVAPRGPGPDPRPGRLGRGGRSGPSPPPPGP